jgi:hypothetical protein
VSRRNHSCLLWLSSFPCVPWLRASHHVQQLRPGCYAAGIADLKMRRADLQSQIYDDEALKQQIEQQIETVRRRISQLSDSVHRRVRVSPPLHIAA